MLLALALAFVLLWALGILSNTAGNLVHVLMVLALVVIVVQVVTGRRLDGIDQ